MQNKRAWLWSSNSLSVDQWSATLRFRVSGQGQKLFGDGFAFWVTESRFIVDGPVHGYTDKFVGETRVRRRVAGCVILAGTSHSQLFWSCVRLCSASTG